MAEPTQPNPDPGSSTPPDPKPTAASQPVDLTKLEGDDLVKVLENPNLFKLPRIAEALNAQKELKTLKEAQDKQTETQLAEQKKFEELATKRGEEIDSLKKQIQDNQVNQTLTGLLVKENVVDLDGALKLVDKSKITIGEDGTASGVQEALDALKTEKTYLFSGKPATPVGAPSNPNNSTTPPTGQYKFKESQLTTEFYNANKAEIDLAGKQGLIEPDGPPQQ